MIVPTGGWFEVTVSTASLLIDVAGVVADDRPEARAVSAAAATSV